jgi:excisionase family DNA binding protein
MTTLQPILTRQETAVLLRVSVRTLERWEEAGMLVPFRIGKNVRYRGEDVASLLPKPFDEAAAS